MKIFRIRLCAFALMLVIALHTYANEQVLTEQQAIALTLSEHPELLSTQQNIKRYGYDVENAKQRKNPSLTLSGDQVNTDNDIEYTVEINQSVDLFGKRKYWADAFQSQKALEGIDYSIRQLKIISDTRKAFAHVIASLKLEQLAIESLELAKNTLDTVTEKADAGRVAPTESIKAEIDWNRAVLERTEASLQVKQDIQSLVLPFTHDTSITYLFNPEFVAQSPVLTLSHYQQLYNDSIYVQRQNIQINSQKNKVDAARVYAKPELVIGGSFIKNENDDSLFGVSVHMELPIFDRGNASTSAENSTLLSLQHTQLYAQREHLLKLTQAHSKALSLKTHVKKLAENIIPSAHLVFNQVKNAYQSGKLPYLELIDAKGTLIELRRAEINTTLLLNLELIQLDLLSGFSTYQ